MQTFFYITFATLEPAKLFNDAQMCGSFYFHTRYMAITIPLAKVIRNPQEPDYDLIYEKQKKCIVGIVAHVFDAHSCWGTGCRF